MWPIECTSEWKDDREEGWVMMTESGADFPYIVYWLALRTVHTVSHNRCVQLGVQFPRGVDV